MKVIIMGCSRVGAQLATALDAEGHKVTVMDIDWDVATDTSDATFAIDPPAPARDLHGNYTTPQSPPTPRTQNLSQNTILVQYRSLPYTTLCARVFDRSGGSY